MDGHGSQITALDFNEPYGLLVAAGADDSVRVWDLCDGEEIGQLRGHFGEPPTFSSMNVPADGVQVPSKPSRWRTHSA